ncbi:3'-5' exoribonuclease YhaM family protein [Viridibacillus arvi]|uniref:3'-5' exoribonuclease YhaM family protein n=1 Tax=Viridibacillus arvi TaxID=263475 RepID=UPI0034CF4D52
MTNIKEGIVDLKQIQKDKQVDGFFIISKAQGGIATNEKPFLTLTLRNKTGDIETKLWSVTAEQKEICHIGSIIKIRAMVQDYKGKFQLNISKIRSVSEQDDISSVDLAPTAPIDKRKVDDEIIQTILSFQNEEIKEIVLRIYKKYQKRFLVSFAAKVMHHACISGLAFHTSTMLEIAKRIAPLYPKINTDYLYATIILHDIMKPVELSESIVAPDYTLEGFLLGHITMITSEIKLVTEELIAEGLIKRDSLVPSILSSNCASHHGKGEWGSPVEPRTIEAELVHHIDMIDSRMYMIGQAVDGAEVNSVVEVKGLRRSFLAHY